MPSMFLSKQMDKKGIICPTRNKNTGNECATSCNQTAPHGWQTNCNVRTYQSKQTPTSPAQTTASAAPLKRSTVSRGVNKSLPGASGFQAPGQERLYTYTSSIMTVKFKATNPLQNKLCTVLISPVTCCITQLRS